MTYTLQMASADSRRALQARITRRWQRIRAHASAILTLLVPIKERSIALAALIGTAAYA